MKKLLAYIRLFRIEHALMLVFAVLFAEFLAAGAQGAPLPAPAIIILSLCVPLFIEMGSFALNDYFDVKTDKANGRKDRPIASGEISPNAALAATAVAYAIGIAASFALPVPCTWIAVIFAALSMLYDWKLKDLPLVGNAYIATSMAIPFLFGALVVSDTIYPSLLAIAAVAFVAGLGREIVKSIEDVEGDVKHRKSRTLPAVIGKANAAGVAAACYFFLVPLSFTPFFFGLPMSTLSVGLVAITALAVALMGQSVMKDQTKAKLEAARKTSLLALGVGLLGYAATLI